MRSALLTGILVLAVVMCVTPIWAQGGPGGPGGPGRGPGPMAIPPTPPADAIKTVAQALSLTTDQATALAELLGADQTILQPLTQAASDADKALRDAFAAQDFDSAVGLADAAAAARLAVTKANIAAWAEIQASGILTADQFAALLAGPGPGGPPPGGAPPSGPGSGNNGQGPRRR